MMESSFLLDESKNSLILDNFIKEKKLSINIIIQYNEMHYSGLCIIGDIIYFGWKNWSYNRSIIDSDRILNIEKYISDGNSIDWLLYFAYSYPVKNRTSIKEPLLEIYDGLHRMTALQNYIVKYEQINKIRCTLRDAAILISIKMFPSKKEIINSFITLNQSVPVNDLYKDIIICDCNEPCECIEENYKAKHIENVANIWISKYATHFKDSKKPLIPNITKNDFIGLIGNLSLIHISEPTRPY